MMMEIVNMSDDDISKQMQEAHEALPEMEAQDDYERRQIAAVEQQRAAYEERRAEEDRNRTWQTQRMINSYIGGGMPGRIIDWSRM
jgi:hypothetical protein